MDETETQSRLHGVSIVCACCAESLSQNAVKGGGTSSVVTGQLRRKKAGGKNKIKTKSVFVCQLKMLTCFVDISRDFKLFQATSVTIARFISALVSQQQQARIIIQLGRYNVQALKSEENITQCIYSFTTMHCSLYARAILSNNGSTIWKHLIQYINVRLKRSHSGQMRQLQNDTMNQPP